MHNFISWLFPHVCIICTQYTNNGTNICIYCRELLPFLKHACVKCGNYNLSLKLITCEQCIERNLQFDKFIAPFFYENPIKKIIQAGKFTHKPYNFNILATFLAKKILASYDARFLPKLLIPVPMHYQNLYERGFNQSILIANVLTKHLNIPNQPHIFVKKHLTNKQSTLTKKKRMHNMQHNVFSLTHDLPEENIAIIDDVLTTGSTINAIADICKNNGATFVHAWCLART